MKSLLQFRCVSKSWQAIIDNLSLAVAQLSFSQTQRGGGRLLQSFSNFNRSKHYFYSSGLGGGEAVRLLSLPGCHKGSNDSPCRCYLSISLHGITCFYNGYQVYVFNPSTRDIRTVPPSTEIQQYAKLYSILNTPYFTYSFGFDPSTKEFRVLHILGMLHGRSTTRLYDLECEVFTVRATRELEEFTSSANSWRKIRNVPPYPYIFKGQGVSVNGAIHWISMKAPGQEVLVAFDVAREKFFLIPLRHDMPPNSDLTEIRGRLAVLGYEEIGNRSIGLWILKDYHRLLWINKSVEFSQNHNGAKVPILVGTNYTGDMLLTQSTFTHHYDLIPCDHKNRTAKTIRIGRLPSWIDLDGSKDISFSIANHMESITPLAPI